ncbi:hypothetical protein [Ruegeria arenilitoris]|uniref:hypothetical protein n=1 Tax=Ruegeria arenilitoris TaxID=1173585 RepID=UPI001481C9A8|nr:hypothetical protein [Ruegeria arenilitoris]
MNDTFDLYDSKVTKSAEGNCYAIFNLCRVGIAASDSTMNIDLANRGGYDALLEAIAELAADAIERLETAHPPKDETQVEAA